MKIYIPRPVTRSVPKDVYDTILLQKVLDCEVVEVIASSNGSECVEHRVRTRNLILSIAKAVYEPFFVMLDSDTALMGETALFEMYTALNKDPYLGAVSLAGAKINGHVDIACTMIRLEAVKNIQFKSHKEGCECNSFRYDISKINYKHTYLDDKQRVFTVKEGLVS
jgi:hypothetical protein